MRKILKWLGFGLAGLVALALLAVGGLYLRARAELNHTYIFQTETVAVPADQASAQHGERLALVYCGACHGREMEGGVIFQDPVLGRLTAPGIAGGLGIGGRSLEDAGLVRAIRYGVGADGKSLLVMPSEAFFYMNDQDLGDLIAYLKSVPPVETTLPATRFTPVGLALIGAGAFGELLSAEKIDPTASRPAAVEPGVTVAYGEYLTQIGECRVCHGENLTGGKDPNPAAPPAPDLTRSGDLASWGDADFMKAIRTGITPDGHLLQGEFMPWPFFGQMTDDEIQAVWLYLQTLPADTAVQ